MDTRIASTRLINKLKELQDISARLQEMRSRLAHKEGTAGGYPVLFRLVHVTAFEVDAVDQAARLGTQAYARKTACLKTVAVPSKISASLPLYLCVILRTRRRANKLWRKLDVNWKPAKSRSRERLQHFRHRYGTVHEQFLCTR